MSSSVQTPVQLPAQLSAGTWKVDTSHSAVNFSVRHLMVAKVRGRFTDFDATITIAEYPLESSVEATIQTASVTTNDDGRDQHLRSPDFFDAENQPTMSYRSTSVEGAGEDYTVHGELTIAGVTRPVDLALEFGGVTTDPWGNLKAGFSARGELSRKDFGLEWNAPLEAGGVLVGDKITLELDIEAAKV